MTKLTRILFVDDDTNLLRAAQRVLRKKLDLTVASSAQEALQIMQKCEPFEVVLSDQNMPDMKGIEFLRETANRWPTTVRIMITGNSDQDTAIAAMNESNVFRFVRKPCPPSELLEAIEQAAKHHALLAAEKDLLEKTLSGSVKVLTEVLAVSSPELFKRSARVHGWAKQLSVMLDLENIWQLEISAMLYPLGFLALPDDITIKYLAGGEMTPEENALIGKCSATGSHLLSNIPRFDGVSETILQCRKSYDGQGWPKDGVKGDQIPVHARILCILIDLTDLMDANSINVQDAINVIRLREDRYDPRLIQMVPDILQNIPDGNRAQSIFDLTPFGLQEGDILARPIKGTNERLLLRTGAELTPILIERLINMFEAGQIEGLVTISRWAEIQADAKSA